MNKACDQLGNAEYIHKSRVHPITLLMAMRKYASGHSEQKGGKVTTWSPIKRIVQALEGAFYLSFANVDPTGLNYCIGLDVSGSMTRKIPTAPEISSCEAAAAITLTIAKTEKNYATVGFSTQIVKLGITAGDDLASAMRKAQMHNFGTTNPGALISRQ